MFKVTGGKGIHLTLPNGLTLSTQLGWGNYCENYDMPYDEFNKIIENHGNIRSDTVEILIWNKDGLEITGEITGTEGSVMGYLTMEEWLEIFDKCRNYKEPTC